jgi:uncharacterized RDD family membrane protein YckC
MITVTAVAVAPTDSAPPRRYVGLVTRALVFGLDAALINAIALSVGALVALTFSVIKIPHEVAVIAAAVGGFVYLIWTVGYFTTFWSTTGQTPGSRLMRIRVVPASGSQLPPRRALLRFVGLTLAIIPLFAGLVPILVDDRRRGLQDFLARTVVIEAEEDEPDPPPHSGRPAPAPQWPTG